VLHANANVPAGSRAHCEARRVRLVPGTRYLFRGLGRVGERWRYPPAECRLLTAAELVRTWQDVVVYEVLTGPDAGRVLAAPLEDWLRNFTEAVGAPPEKVLDHRVQGSGV
jgi:hypothetical protein